MFISMHCVCTTGIGTISAGCLERKYHCVCIKYFHTSTSHFIVLCFIVLLCRYCVFKIIEALWEPCENQIYQHNFSNSICSLGVSPLHFGNSHKFSIFFIIMYKYCVSNKNFKNSYHKIVHVC